jgi:hypothetical protein
MKAWLSTLWHASLLQGEALGSIRDRGDVFFQGFLVIVVVSLLVGLPAFAQGVVNAARPAVTEAQFEAATSELDLALRQVAPLLGGLPTATRQGLDEIAGVAKTWIGAGVEISNLPAVLPRPLGALLQAFGAWLSLPFTRGGFPLGAVSLGIWLGYGLWVMLLAKLLGGRGTLAGFFGTSAVYAVPHVLSFFAWIPCLGALLSLIAFLWGIVIYVKATAISHRLTVGRSLLAVFLPMLVIALVVIVGAALVGALASGMLSTLFRSQ